MSSEKLSAEDKALLEEDKRIREEELRKKREEVMAKFAKMGIEENWDGSFTHRFSSNFEFVSHVADIIDQIGIDLTYTYERWFRLAFCLANEFGEEGRSIFHRLSSHHPEYDYYETDKRYTEQLTNTRGSITLGSLIYWLREDGVIGSGE